MSLRREMTRKCGVQIFLEDCRLKTSSLWGKLHLRQSHPKENFPGNLVATAAMESVLMAMCQTMKFRINKMDARRHSDRSWARQNAA